MIVQNFHFWLDSKGEPPRPICVEFKHLRRSGRATSTKRTYKNIANTTGRLAKKPKHTVDELAHDALVGTNFKRVTDAFTSGDPTKAFACDEPATSEPATSKPATSEPASDKPATSSDLPVLCSKTPEASNTLKPHKADVPTSATHIQISSSDTISVLLEGGILPMTHSDGLAILDEYFEQPATGAGPANDADSLGSRPMILSESRNQDKALEATASFDISRSKTQQSQVVGENAVLEAFAKPNPDLAAASAAASESSSSIGSSKVGSLFTDPTSVASSEAHINNDLLTSEIQDPPFLKRAVLDKSAQWLEGVLIALGKVDDTSRNGTTRSRGIWIVC
jgi:hypothetical protein